MDDVCPGEKLTYTCSIDGTDATLWNITPRPHQCEEDVIALARGTQTCGPFSAQITSTTDSCSTSTLTVTYSPELNGTVITCEDNAGSVAGNATIPVAGRQTL